MMEYVRGHCQKGDVYLLPVAIPPVGTGRGAVSTSFRPPKREETALIQVDLQRFRLLAEAPIYVDFKSVPYKDSDVLEWYRRMKLCQNWYQHKDQTDPTVLKGLGREGITHIVTKAGQALDTSSVQKIYEDKRYSIYRLRNWSTAGQS
jgi:hypothetical protein